MSFPGPVPGFKYYCMTLTQWKDLGGLGWGCMPWIEQLKSYLSIPPCKPCAWVNPYQLWVLIELTVSPLPDQYSPFTTILCLLVKLLTDPCYQLNANWYTWRSLDATTRETTDQHYPLHLLITSVQFDTTCVHPKQLLTYVCACTSHSNLCIVFTV